MIAVRMPRRSKYGAQAVVIDGIRFASKREARRYAELKLLAKAGEISGLELQFKMPFSLDDTIIFTYVADFTYTRYRLARWERVVEDVKGFKTPLYKLKKRLIESQYKLEIREV
jgi:hypothetical protein